MPIDFGPTCDDYAAHRPAFVPQLFERLGQFQIGLPGQSILDLGAGTGLFSRGLAANGAKVTMLDGSDRMLRRSDEPFRIAAIAEKLPFANDAFDIVTAAQAWHWFDRQKTPAEVFRVLRPGGALAVVYQMYVPMPQSVAEATEKLILKFNPGWRHANSAGINGQVLRDMQASGFEQIESFTFDAPIGFSREAWHGYIRTTSPVGASMSPAQIREFDQEHQLMLKSWPAELTIPQRVFAAIARKPSPRI